MTSDAHAGAVQHIVLLTFSPEATDETIQAAAVALRGLPKQIPEIMRFQVSVDLGLTEGNAQLSVVADFASHDDYLRYAENADHQRVIAEHIKGHVSGRTASQSPLE